MGLGTELTPSAGTEGAPDHPAISPAPILCFEAPFLRKWSPRFENTWQYGKVERERERRKGQLQNRCQGSVRTQSTARPHTQGFLSAEHSEGHSLSVRPRAGKHWHPHVLALDVNKNSLWKAIWQFRSKFLNACLMASFRFQEFLPGIFTKQEKVLYKCTALLVKESLQGSCVWTQGWSSQLCLWLRGHISVPGFSGFVSSLRWNTKRASYERCTLASLPTESSWNAAIPVLR